MNQTNPTLLDDDMIDLGGGNFIHRVILADALIRGGFLTPAGLLPRKGLLGGFRDAT
jgi:hypothetical protein